MTFQDCVMECAKNRELVAEFNRLNHSKLLVDTRKPIEIMVDRATGYQEVLDKKQHEWMQQFISFVFECIWMPLITEED